MHYTILNLRSNALMLNYQYYALSVSKIIQEIESQLRAILSYQTIEVHLVTLLDDTLSILKTNVEKSSAYSIEKQRIYSLIYKVQRKIEVRIYNPKRLKISNYTREKLIGLKKYGYIGNITITSTGRSVEDQARIMYDNIQKYGKQHQLDTYKQPGKNVINTYNEEFSRDQNIINMAKAIRKEGPEYVSRHVGDFDKLNVIDVDKRSLSNIQAFKDSVKQAGFTKVLDENGCIHIELPQPQ